MTQLELLTRAVLHWLRQLNRPANVMVLADQREMQRRMLRGRGGE